MSNINSSETTISIDTIKTDDGTIVELKLVNGEFTTFAIRSNEQNLIGYFKQYDSSAKQFTDPTNKNWIKSPKELFENAIQIRDALTILIDKHI